jgi:hypothetical protein
MNKKLDITAIAETPRAIVVRGLLVVEKRIGFSKKWCVINERKAVRVRTYSFSMVPNEVLRALIITKIGQCHK